MTLCNAVIKHCAPTLAGIKTGNLFSLNTGGRDIIPEIRILNGILVKKGIRLIPLRKHRQNTLIYLYRPEKLCKDLAMPEAVNILLEKGYPCGYPELCVTALIRRLVSGADFPHEIGLFLGYPPSDVKGFMNSPCNGVQCVGCWKVYGNRQEAERIFQRFRKCTDVYCRAAKGGMTLERLAVDNRKEKNKKVVNV